MIFPNIYAIHIIGVFDRGIANNERIVFKADTWLNLAEFGVMIGFTVDDNLAKPYLDHLFHFPEIDVDPGTLIFLYTGPGKNYKGNMPKNAEPFHVLHWGKPSTVFAHSSIVPILFQVGAIEVGRRPIDLPQIKQLR